MRIRFNRWFIIPAGMSVELCLGALYAWSIFVRPFEQDLGWTRAEVSLAFTIACVTFAGVMLWAGRLQDKHGPRITCTIGAVLIGLGYILGSFTQSLAWLYFTYGFLNGAGMAFAYISALGAALRWFPDKRGLAAGLVVGGFGAGGLAFAPLGMHLMGPEMDWSRAFLIFGITFLIVVGVLAQVLRNPPADWKPKGWEPPPTSLRSQARDFSPGQVLKTSQFWLLWLAYCFGCTAGLMVIGHLHPFGVESGLTVAAATITVSVLAFANGTGRPLWGFLLELLGMRKTIPIIYGIQGTIMLCLIWLGYPLIALLLAALAIGLNFGGKLASFPTITTDFFGTRNVGANYSMMFTAWGTAGIVGPMLGGIVYDITGEYKWAFISAGLLCFIGGAIATITVRKPPEPALPISNGGARSS